jgi:predicted nucleotidyltransferase
LDAITRDVVRAAQEILGNKLEKVLLYGSYARGDYDDESDIDIMVLADVPAEEAHRADNELIRITSRLDLKYDALISVRVKDCATFYEWLEVVPFYQNVLKDGVLLSA